MKRATQGLLILLLGFIAGSLSIGKHALAYIPIDGGVTTVTSTSPVPGSAKWDPPSNTWPDSNNLGGDSDPYYVVGNVPGVYDKSVARIKVLVKSGSSFDLTVDNAGSGCNSAASAGLRGPDYSQGSTVGGPNTSFVVQDNNGNNIKGPVTQTAADGCNDYTFNNINTNAGSLLPGGSDANYGYDRYFWLIASAFGAVQGENSFKVQTSDSSYVVSIGETITGYGYRDRDLNNGNYWTSNVVFSVNQSCSSLSNTQGGTITYYDADADEPGWNPNLQFLLQREPWADDNNWSTVVARSHSYLVNNSTDDIVTGYNFSSVYKYRVVLQNVGVRNTIFISIKPNGAGAGISQLSARYHYNSTVCNPPPNGTCSQVGVQHFRPGVAGSVKVKITNTGQVTLQDPPTVLGIIAPPNLSRKTPIGGDLGAGSSRTISVPISEVPDNNTGSPLTIPSYRTYQLYDPTNGYYGTPCPVTIIVDPSNQSYGDLTDAGCSILQGHIWGNGAGANQARLLFSASGLPDQGSTSLGTTGGSYDGSGNPDNHNQWFSVGTYFYLGGASEGPHNSVQLDYHHVYTMYLQQETSPGNWVTLANTSGNEASAQIQYPCITGNIQASCTAVTGSLNYLSGSADGTIGQVVADGNSNGHADISNAQNGYSLDPFNVATGINILPHQAHQFDLTYRDPIDGGYYEALSDQPGGGNAATTRAPCLTFDPVCSPGATTDFEIGTSKSVDYSYGYSNQTIHNWPQYYGALTSDGTVLINGGQGPINSTAPGDTVKTPGGSFTWNGTQVSSTGANPYDGHVYEAAYISGNPSPLAGPYPCKVEQVTKPYFKIYGSSASTGGAFNPASMPNGTANCADGSQPNDGQSLGGVKAFAKFNPTTSTDPNSYTTNAGKYGASIEYSIESLGLIQGNNPNSLGFYSGDTHDPPDGVNTLDVGNQNAGWGGNLGGIHCVTNYYSAYINSQDTDYSTTPDKSVNGMFDQSKNITDANGNHLNAEAFNATGNVSLDGGTGLPSAHRVTLFVDGDVYINSDIIYDQTTQFVPGDRSGPNGSNATAPAYFTLIAKGNIYVDPSVHELDGLYVAQGSNGFSTCGDSASKDNNMPANGIVGQCINKLIVKGAAIASQFKLLRIGNTTTTVNSAPTFDHGSSIYSPTNNNAVEEFDYTPQMLENQPYYMVTSGNAGLGATEKIYSLPPVY